ncbi:MAG: hypothetical protein JKX68_13185 [Flavobacteriales bacterium]|nr:hypothetical protein [Flavobacteriales bacterium]
MKYKLILTIIISSLCYSCGNDTFTPKPKGYFRIDLPKKEYYSIEKDCPFTFETPNYTEIKPNINNPDKSCWFDIVFENLNASIYMSYKPVENNLHQYLEDSRSLAFKHTVKAFDIEQLTLSFPEKKSLWISI